VIGPDEQLRVRAVYLDEKHGQFSAYVDYMIPSVPRNQPKRTPVCTPQDLASRLRDGVQVPYFFALPKSGVLAEADMSMAEHTGEAGNATADTDDAVEGYWGSEFRSVSWYVRVIAYSPSSDHYDPTHHDYYPERALDAFTLGGTWGALLDDHVDAGDWLRVDAGDESTKADAIFLALLEARRARSGG
jgi:hypothetical protein